MSAGWIRSCSRWARLRVRFFSLRDFDGVLTLTFSRRPHGSRRALEAIRRQPTRPESRRSPLPAQSSLSFRQRTRHFRLPTSYSALRSSSTSFRRLSWALVSAQPRGCRRFPHLTHYERLTRLPSPAEQSQLVADFGARCARTSRIFELARRAPLCVSRTSTNLGPPRCGRRDGR